MQMVSSIVIIIIIVILIFSLRGGTSWHKKWCLILSLKNKKNTSLVSY